MKKTLIAMAALAVSGAAIAQTSTVTLYGVVDANLERIKGATTVNRLQSGGNQGSRWGLRGTEDLGGGLKATFVLENGFTVDNGNLGQGGRMFGRQAFVGLGGSFGTVRFGRQYTPTDEVAGLIGTKTYDVLAVARIMGVENNDRLDNTITYLTPSLGGLEAQVQYSLGNEGTTAASPNLNETFSIGGVYKAGPLALGLGFINVIDSDAATAGDQRRQGLLLTGNYNFGPFSLGAYYGNQDQAAEKLKIVGVNAAMPFGATTVSIGAAQVNDVNGSTADDDATIFTLQARHDLSKRTALYAHLTAVSNDGSSALGFNTPAAGQSSNGIQFGVRHRF